MAPLLVAAFFVAPVSGYAATGSLWWFAPYYLGLGIGLVIVALSRTSDDD
jgi:Flp pilus assembly protein protease CpaA